MIYYYFCWCILNTHFHCWSCDHITWPLWFPSQGYQHSYVVNNTTPITLRIQTAHPWYDVVMPRIQSESTTSYYIYLMLLFLLITYYIMKIAGTPMFQSTMVWQNLLSTRNPLIFNRRCFIMILFYSARVLQLKS